MRKRSEATAKQRKTPSKKPLLNHKDILAEWSKIYLVGDFSDWSIDIDLSINLDFATIALFLDYRTAKASGETTDVYGGFKKASLLVLDLLEIQIIEEPEAKTIRLVKKESSRIKDKKLAEEIWG